MTLENAPLSIAISILEVGHTIEISKTAYFEDLESIPWKPFMLLNSNLKSILGSERSNSNHDQHEG
jgi:hypothetical protein